MNLKVLALFAAFLSLHANADSQKNLTALEVLNRIGSDCVVKIGDQAVNIEDVDYSGGNGVNQVTLKTDALDREDGVFAIVALYFKNHRKVENSSIYRVSGLNAIELRAENARSWGQTALKTDRIKRLQILLAETRQKNLELKAEAWIGRDEKTKTDIGQAALLTCKTSNLVDLLDLEN